MMSHPSTSAEISTLHTHISLGDLEEVKKFAQKFSNDHLCIDINSNKDALQWSVECHQFEIYAFLRAHGFITNDNKKLNELIEDLTHAEKLKIRNENLKYIKNPDFYVDKLLSKCSFDACSPNNIDNIREMVLALNKFTEIQAVFKVAADAEIKIIFDQQNMSIYAMDPTGDETQVGRIIPARGLLYVGNGEHQDQCYGTFVHELTHLVMFLIYENNCLPYCKGDTAKEAEWNNVVEKTRETYQNDPDNTEPIISRVFKYYSPGFEQRAELIVRVNEILATYRDNPQRITQLEATFGDLFNFYRRQTLPDMQTPNALAMIQLNNDFEVFETLNEVSVDSINSTLMELQESKVIISSNSPRLTHEQILQWLRITSRNPLHVKVQNLFVNLKKIEQLTLKREFQQLLETRSTRKIIVDGQKIDEENLKFFNEITREIFCWIIVDSKLFQTMSFPLEKFDFSIVNVHHVGIPIRESFIDKLIALILKMIADIEKCNFDIKNYIRECMKLFREKNLPSLDVIECSLDFIGEKIDEQRHKVDFKAVFANCIEEYIKIINENYELILNVKLIPIFHELARKGALLKFKEYNFKNETFQEQLENKIKEHYRNWRFDLSKKIQQEEKLRLIAAENKRNQYDRVKRDIKLKMSDIIAKDEFLKIKEKNLMKLINERTPFVQKS